MARGQEYYQYSLFISEVARLDCVELENMQGKQQD